MSETSLKETKLSLTSEDTKSSIRLKIWDYLDAAGLASYPKLPRRRISNFVGSDEVGDKIAELEIFKKAKVLRIDPDKPLQEIRFKTLEAEKVLLVPTPRLRNHVFSKIVPPKSCSQQLLRKCAARKGVKDYSQPVDIDEKQRIDLVVVGCIAASSKGWRIGKGGGLSDLQYAMLASLGLVDNETPVVTMVHDDQVLDLDEKLFQNHDLPVDYIVTPTRVIKCEGGHKKPSGVIWDKLTQEKLNHIPVLRRIRYRDWKNGKEVRLEGESEEPKDLQDVISEEAEVLEDRGPIRRRFSRFRQKKKEADEGETTGEDEKKVERKRMNVRSFKNRNYNKSRDHLGSDGQTDDDGGKKIKNNFGANNRTGRKFYAKRRNLVEGSIYVGSLPRSLRVSEFKSEVRERKVNPLRVLWRGTMGFAFLNFKSQQDAEEALQALEGLHISEKALRLEMAKSSIGKGKTNVENHEAEKKNQ